MSDPVVVPVILAGGSGLRLWPLSRKAYPKQFLCIGGDRTLLQDVALRAMALNRATSPVVICGEAHRFLVSEQLREIGIEDAMVVLEPEPKSTAPAAAVAALWVQRTYGDDALVFIMSADHVISNNDAFIAAVEVATHAAARGRLLAFGIHPTRPDTGYGYLSRGEAVAPGIYRLERFIEKPDSATAERLLADGSYFWNGGLFLFPAATFLAELRQFEPDMLALCIEALGGARLDMDFLRLEPSAFKLTRYDSIDYAVMVKTSMAEFVLLDAGWDDVGSWSYLTTLPRDADDNYIRGDVLLHACRNVQVYSHSRLVAALGVQDLTIIETEDALLVTTSSESQNVKAIVEVLRQHNREEADSHPVVHRPWGTYHSIARGMGFQVKRIVVNPGRKLSSQMHRYRSEHWIVVSGAAVVVRGETIQRLCENQSTYIPQGEVHRLENPGDVPLVVIEVQSGVYLGEDDIVRFDDEYNRGDPSAK